MLNMCILRPIIVCCCILYQVRSQGISFFTPSSSSQCKTPTGQIGFCTRISKCPTFVKGIDPKNPPFVCEFDNRNPTVCCPMKTDGFLVKNDTGGTVAFTGISAPKTSFECGKNGFIKTSRIRQDILDELTSSEVEARLDTLKDFGPTVAPTIAGGVHSVRFSWPWMALLGRKRNVDDFFFCDGVLINEKFVLTAAHCLQEKGKFFVRLGEHDYSGNVLDLAVSEDLEIKKVTLYPDYDPNFGYHDLALIELLKKAKFSDSIRPVCLPWGNLLFQDVINKRVTVTGWGAERYGGRPSPILQEVEITVFKPSVCEKSYSALMDFKKIWPLGMKANDIVCAGEKNGGKDACQGDSGGPLVHQHPDETYSLVGIVSKGYGCGKPDFPGVYAPIRNRNHLQWIKDTAF